MAFQDQTAPRYPALQSDIAKALAVVVASIAVTLAYFAVLDRPWGCDCGRLWAMPGEPALNSRVMLDPYSALHLIFGAVLALILRRVRPGWSGWTILAVVVAGSTVWEVVENLPSSIRLFGYEAGDPLSYEGDSRLNALADTASAALGAVLARGLSGRVVLAVAAVTELGLSLWINDGFAIATLRAMGQFV
ncbi:DUF2585 family protein [Paracoccus hibiscisoli]|uniref:DUF2585 family protein n=1 Tax=Paracoccus hibiscisoli TaxID=2023261 RepID=A0A4U0QRR7_9RHOB|nr:DUF2585 family protein [Paracoccus hibiscisoli]TJZ84536.1 DUF2585 family protein [Paracoccus hibiscisoli]